MIKIISVISLLIFCWVSVYLCFSYVHLDFNLLNWSYRVRCDFLFWLSIPATLISVWALVWNALE